MRPFHAKKTKAALAILMGAICAMYSFKWLEQYILDKIAVQLALKRSFPRGPDKAISDTKEPWLGQRFEGAVDVPFTSLGKSEMERYEEVDG